MLAMLYATYIIKGQKTFSEVPDSLKAQVKTILEEQNLGHLAV